MQQKTGFFKSKIQEIKKISWTSPRKLIKDVIIVLVFTIFFTISVFLVDMFISYILGHIISML